MKTLGLVFRFAFCFILITLTAAFTIEEQVENFDEAVTTNLVASETCFLPSTHGWKFPNTFDYHFLVRAFGDNYTLFKLGKGLCGGMSFSALDKFYQGEPIPNITQTPDNEESLAEHITNRQQTSVKYGLVAIEVFDWITRNDEGHWWDPRKSVGHLTKQNMNLAKIKIDQGKPVVLVLVRGEGISNLEAADHSHQVVAYKYVYDAERQNTKFWIYDPNYPGEDDVTLEVDHGNPNSRVWIYHSEHGKWYKPQNGPSYRERGFFVNEYDKEETPPEPVSCERCFDLGINNFATDQGWTNANHERLLGYVNKGKNLDIVGFGTSDVYVSTGNGDGRFNDPVKVFSYFTYDRGWRKDKHIRLLGDANGDGQSDIIAFSDNGVEVAYGIDVAKEGKFTQPVAGLRNMCYNKGWRVDRNPRMLAYVNGDERIDIIGFSDDGVRVALADENGRYNSSSLVLRDFGYNAGDWRPDRHPITIGDMNGDGFDDIVGFAERGVMIAYANQNGGFKKASLEITGYGAGADAGSWTIDRHPRMVADIDGDGKDDIVGFGEFGVSVAFSNGDSFTNPQTIIHNYGANGQAGNWRVDKHPRTATDLDGDGKADIVGFSDAGVFVAFSQGRTFEAPRVIFESLGSGDKGGYSWADEDAIRTFANIDGDEDGTQEVIGFGRSGVYVSTCPIRGDQYFSNFRNTLADGQTTAFRSPKNKLKLKVFPNQFRQNTTLEFVLDQDRRLNIAMFDLQGRFVYRVTSDFFAGKNEVQIHRTNQMAAGMYILSIDGEGVNLREKVLVVD